MNTQRLSNLLAAAGDRFDTLPPAATVGETAAIMAHHDIAVIAVLDDGRLEGLLTRSDVLRFFADTTAPLDLKRNVSDLMTRELTVAAPDTTLSRALKLMARNGIGYLPVVEHVQLLGIVSERELLRSLLEALQSDYRQMQEYIDHLHQAGQD